MFEDLNSAQGPVLNNRPQKLLLTYDDASKALSVSPGTLRKLAKSGRLKVTHINRCVRISHEEILRLSSGQLSEATNV